MMMGTKFNIKKFDGTNDFALWQVRMKALLEQQGLAAALEELPATTIAITKETTTARIWKKLETLYMTKSLSNSLYLKKKLYTFNINPGNSRSGHIDEFHKLVGDLAAIDTAISDEDLALLLLTSLPSSYDNFMETLLYGRDTLKLEDVLATVNSRELLKMTKAKGNGGEGLYSKENLKKDCPKYNHKKSQGFVRNKDQVYGSRTDGYDNVDVMMAIKYDRGNIQLGDGREYRVWGTCKVYVHIRVGSSFVLDNVKYVLELKQKLISLGTLKKEGFTVEMESGMIKVIKGSLVVLSRTRRSNCVYTLNGQEVTKKTLKGSKQLGEYQTGWNIKTGNVLDSYTQSLDCPRHIGFNESGEYKKTFIGSGIVGSQEVQTQDLIYYHSTRDREQHSAWELFSYREDSNEDAFAVAIVDKIYAHKLLTFNNTVACEVISKWNAGLKEDMDVRSDVYVLSNGCRKNSDNNHDYYWEYAPAKGNLLGVEIIRDQSGNTLRGSLVGDYDVEKNGKWSCIYAVGSHEYQMVCTRLDIASANVGMLDKFDHGLQTDVRVFVDFDYTIGRPITVMAGYMTLTEAANEAIWLKGLAIESGFELKIVADIASGALSKAIPGSRFHHSLNLLSIGIG
ncbi:hypothetical protein Tco_0966963 [Tanacetum coccineum]